MIHFLSPSWLKKAERFSKGVKKFIAYQRDLIPDNRLMEVNDAKSAYDAALKAKDRQSLDDLEKKLLKVCEGAVPNYNASPLKENVEVIIVAVIVALGIRAYYLQPFKIPTASMQPTLNGIIASRLEGAAQSPNFLLQGFQYAWNGRNYVEVKVPAEWGETELLEYRQYSRLNFFTFTELRFSNQQTLRAYAPAKQLLGGYYTHEGRKDVVGMWRDDSMTLPAMNAGSDDTNGWVKLPSQKVKGGDTLARGFVESGDQLLVDKVSYHFRRPHRDDVFVFSTENIAAIGKNQHYIKRLVALPGDRLRVEEPDLFINGEKSTGTGSLKVAKQEAGYGGYTIPKGQAPGGNYVGLAGPNVTEQVTLPDEGYMAMGDNSANSYDSRNWGAVPERNVVGPALFVYWPFANHWGIIR